MTINAVNGAARRKGEIIFSTAACIYISYFAYRNTIFQGPGAHLALIEKYELL